MNEDKFVKLIKETKNIFNFFLVWFVVLQLLIFISENLTVIAHWEY